MKPDLPPVAVVIPHLTGSDMLDRCLEALAAQTAPHTTIVVAQGKEDGSKAMMAKKYPEVQVLPFANNAGFAGGVNRGIRPALEQGFELIALLNNDALAEPDWLERLLEAAHTHPEAGIITSKILRTDGKTLDSTGDFYTSWGFSYPRGRDEADTGQYDGPEQQEIFSGSGGASLYRARLLQEIGLFDEAFFAYYEDVDISFRAQLGGWKVRYEPRARVLHEVSATSSKMKSSFSRYHTVKNFIYLYTKNMPGWLYWKYLPKYWAAYALLLGRDLTKGRAGTTLKATGEAMRHLPEILRQRRRIQSARRASLAYIDSLIEHQMPPTQQKVLGIKRQLALKGKISKNS